MTGSAGTKHIGNAISKETRLKFGQKLQRKCPLALQGHFSVGKRSDVAILLTAQDDHRLRHLLPIKYERMAASPFGFYRGAASIMAAGLHESPASGLAQQVCGDCHLLNFGGFATPERQLVFDINDFDETSRAPWEWDLKRLAASFYIAAAEKNFGPEKAAEAVWNMADSYRKHIGQYAEMSALQLWYSQISLKNIAPEGKIKNLRQFNPKKAAKAIARMPHEREFEKLAVVKNGTARIKDDLPLLFHVDRIGDGGQIFRHPEIAYEKYLKSLSHDKRLLLGRYRIQDTAMKVVGVGSVGMRCGVMLLMSATGEPLFLQFKEAGPGALENYAVKSRYSNSGRRVVEGQKLIQSATDIFLGWTRDSDGKQYYIRQLRDAKIKPALEVMDAEIFNRYARSCGWALARAHSRTGDPSVLYGYMGDSDAIADAMVSFAEQYSLQNEIDYDAMLAALRSGKITI